MAIKTALRSVGGSAVIFGLMSGSALAGGPAYCGVAGCDPVPPVQRPAPHCGSAGCDTGITHMRAPRGHSGTTTVENRTPYDFLDSVHFQRSPHVSITRIHGLSPTIGLSDSPVGFTQGCHPQSTAYCRTGGHGSASATASASANASSSANSYASANAHASASAYSSANTSTTRPYTGPIIRTPTHETVSSGPTYTQSYTSNHSSVSAPTRIVATGGGFDPSKFTPRIYGDPYTITPGIAYLPTSVIDRNPYHAQAVLDAGPGGITPALTGMPIGPLPRPRPYGYQQQMMGMQTQGHYQAAPMRGPMMQPRIIQSPQVQMPQIQVPATHMSGRYQSIPTGQPGAAGAPYQISAGRYGSTVGADGTYWEKVSGPTRFGDTVATQVICKRKLPHQPAPYPALRPHPTPYPMPPEPCGVRAKSPGRY